jgi:uncharacterized protein (TIGR03437 family)
MSTQRLFLFALVTASTAAGANPFFEPDPRGGFLGRWPHANVHVDPSGIAIDGLTLRWKQPADSVRAEQKLAGITNYFFGNDPEKWRAGVPHYSRVRVSGETGIVVYASGKNLEFDFEIPPGQDASSAAIDFPESAQLTLAGGAISIEANGRQYRLDTPVIYQTRAGRRERIQGRFILENPHRVAFSVGEYDPAEPLVIDPILEWLTYYGGNGEDQILASATDSAGNVYLGGGTTSTNLPFIGGGLESANPGTAAFITKLNPSGTEILYSTYLGGVGFIDSLYPDAVRQLVIDASGNAYALGNTASAQFPITAAAWVPSYSGSFALKLDPTGSNLLYSTFIGVPSVGIESTALAVDPDGDAYIGGYVGGPQFIGTAGSYQPNSAGNLDGIILVLNPTGTGLKFGTMFGGSAADEIRSLVLDANGNVIIGGATSSTDLPVTNGSTLGGTGAGFLAALDPTGAHLLWSTYLTGSAQVGAMTVVGPNVVACGLDLPTLEFAATVTPAEPFTGAHSGFVAEFDASSGAPQLLSIVTGYCSAITADPHGYIYLSARGFGALSGGSLAFGIETIAMLSPDLSQVLFNSPVGPDFYYSPSNITALAADAAGRLSFAGYTGSLYLPTTAGVIQPRADPAPRTTSVGSTNPDDGFAGRFDLSVFRQGNFLISQFSKSTYSFNVGSTAVIETIPVVINGSVTLQASASVPWLTVEVVPGGIQVSPNASATPVTNAQIQIFVSAAEIPGSQVTLSTEMTVLGNPTFTVDTTPVAISVYSGIQASTATRNITYNFAQQYFTFTTVSSNPSWLFAGVNPGSGNGQAQLQINVGTLAVGTYSGTITVSIAGASNPPQVVPVTYTVLPAPILTITTTSLTMAVQPGQTTTTSMSLASSVPNFPVSFYLGTGETWLTAALSANTTPCKLILTASPPPGTAAGIYYFNGTVALTPGLSVTQFAGSVGVSGASGITAVPASITTTYYRQQQNQQFSIQVVAPQTTTVALTADQPWIAFSSSTIVTPNYSYVFFNVGSLAEGTYTANIFVRDTSGKTLQTIPVSFKLYNEAVLTYSTAPIAFQYNQGDPPPPSQTLHISSPTLLPGYFGIGVRYNPSWLTASPSYGFTPADITLTANPAGLAPGVYTLNLQISPQGGPAGTTGGGTIPATLTVSGPAHPLISAVINAASGLPGPVSPGELVLIYGAGLGGASVSSSQLVAGSLPTSWSGTTVTFDEFDAPVLYTAGNVVCVSVPYGVAGRSSVAVAVSFNSNQGPSTPVSIGSSAPGFFTADESGTGQVSAFTVNPDGTYQLSNSSHPATAGDILVLYLTGAGVVSPSSPDGSVNSTLIGYPAGPVTATIGNLPAQVVFCATVPGLLNGVLQVNLTVPSGVPLASPAELSVFIGGNATQPGVTLALR